NYKTYKEEDVEFVSVASEDELGNGQRILLEIDGQAIALFNIAGELFAIADVCSHDDGPLAEGELEAYEIECPRHGAHFDLRTGKVLTLPAVVDIPAYPVRVVEGDVLIGLPLEE
ncbi:MAG TPA: non-heme iron oxygenase ferredoxin subunit, partial [Anaerolineales bacterium]|nr:non-heme iron oxygenase ferredoxin subunit [Anaerolineales bacterium]